MRKESPQPDNTNEESTIFSHHKSADSIRQKQKQEKRQQRQALARELTATSSETRKVTLVMAILLAVLVIGCAVVVAIQLHPAAKDMAADSAHFENTDALPELSQEGIKAIVTEAYYTNDGSLAVNLKMSNGLPSPQTVESFSVSLSNADGKDLAYGHQAKDWDATFSVPANNYADLLVYIPADDVKIKDDTLETITSEIEITGVPKDPSVLKTTTTAAK